MLAVERPFRGFWAAAHFWRSAAQTIKANLARAGDAKPSGLTESAGLPKGTHESTGWRKACAVCIAVGGLWRRRDAERRGPTERQFRAHHRRHSGERVSGSCLIE